MKILSCRNGHNASASICVDGKVVAEVCEERFTRIKNDTSFPLKAIAYCLKTAGLQSTDLDAIAIPSEVRPGFLDDFFVVGEDNPIEVHSPSDTLSKKVSRHFSKKHSPVALPLYMKRHELRPGCEIHLVNHHMAHAASACYTSGFEGRSLAVTMDGRGDGVSNCIWSFEDNRLKLLHAEAGNSSMGWFYSCATEALMWMHGCDEWKVMGLAPYGTPQPGSLDGLHPVFADGKLTLGIDYGPIHRFHDHGAVHYACDFSKHFLPVIEKIGREDFAAEVQRVSEEQAKNFILPWLEKLDTDQICCAGGFFLNVKFNQKLWESGKVKKHWVYPEPGDAGLCVGSSLYVENATGNTVNSPIETFTHGPEFSNDEIREILDSRAIEYRYCENIEDETAKLLMENKCIGWFQGRLEAGPRALGSRSIIMSPLRAENKDVLNAKIKYREAFRPFCPSMLFEAAQDYLENYRDEFFMTCSFKVKEEKKERIPAVVHVDGTARPQFVKKENNARYHRLIEAFGELSGERVIVNTSFNIKGEPIVCNPREAIKCFYDTGIDALAIGNFLLVK